MVEVGGATKMERGYIKAARRDKEGFDKGSMGGDTKGCVDRAFIHQECKVVSPTFTIPKRDGSLRLIRDLIFVDISMRQSSP